MVRNACFPIHDTRLAVGARGYHRDTRTGLALAESHKLSVYDAMIAASALLADCDTLLSGHASGHGILMRLAARIGIIDQSDSMALGTGFAVRMRGLSRLGLLISSGSDAR